MSKSSQEQPSIDDIFRVVLRHRKKVILFITTVILLTAIYVLSIPRTYLSEAKLLVLVGRESVSLDPIVSTGKTLDINSSRETEINTLLEILKCRAVMAKVVEEVGVDEVLKPREQEGIADRAKQFVSEAMANLRLKLQDQIKEWTDQPEGPPGDDTASRRELAIKLLKESISISAAKQSTVITVSAEAHSPGLAQTFVTALVDVYKREHMTLHSTAGSEDFFHRQKQMIDDQLAEKRVEISALRSNLGIGSVEAEFKRLEDEKASIASLRNSLSRELAGTTAKCNALILAVGSAEEVILTERAEGMSNQATDGIRQKLFELEIAEGRASRTYTEDHPELARVRAQLQDLRDSFTSEQADRTELRYGRNVAREKLRMEYEEQQTRAAELKAQLESADEQEKIVLALLQELNESTVELDKLVQDIAFLERSYDTYSDSLEQSRIGSSLTQQQISNVNVAQAATFVSEPIPSKRKMIAIAGLMAAFLGAIPLAFFMEYLDCRLKSPAEVEASTDLSVLVTLPTESNPLKIPELAKSANDVG